jgi:predicted nucleic acid-binding protein
MRVFFDSSAFAKRYIDEPGTEQVLTWCDRADELVLSVIALPELISAFCRLRREARLTPAQYRQIKQDLLADLADAQLCDTSPQLLKLAVQALEASALRGMDAIHIGSAQVCEADVFVSANARQCDAARAVGLQVVAL